MTPTNYLRQVPIETRERVAGTQYERVLRDGYRLQQWCYTNDETGGAPVYLNAVLIIKLMRGDEVEGGKWRDVPIAESV